MRSSIIFPFDKPITTSDLKVSFGVQIIREDGEPCNDILTFDLVAIAERLDQARQRLEINSMEALGGTITLRPAKEFKTSSL